MIRQPNALLWGSARKFREIGYASFRKINFPYYNNNKKKFFLPSRRKITKILTLEKKYKNVKYKNPTTAQL
jgi:hypothetical protein